MMRSVEIVTNHGPKTFLVDTGATVSIINKESTDKNMNIDTKQQQALSGLTGNQRTKGSTVLILSIGRVDYSQKFHVLPDTCKTPYDGILGMDFLKTFDAIYDLKEEQLRLQLNGNEEAIPFIGMATTSLLVPPRCEYRCSVVTMGNGEVVTKRTQLATGVYLAQTVTTVNEGKAQVLLLNTTNDPVELKDLEVETEPLNDFDIAHGQEPIATRKRKLRKQLKLDHLPKGERDVLLKVCMDFADLFQLEDEPLSIAKVGKQRIHVKPGTIPVYKKPFRNPHHQRKLVQEYVEKLKKDKIIEPSISSWNAPLLLIPKKAKDANGNRQYRVCIDYRGLNAVLEPDRYPLPNIKEVIDQLGGASYYTTMDLSQGYFQVGLEDKSRPMTAFVTPDGEHFQMTRMPMGLCNSPADFMRKMNIAMAGLKGTHCFIYIDDIIVFAKTFNEHLSKLRDVFHRLREVNLRIRPNKTALCQRSVIFLGFEIDGEGIRMDPAKKAEVENWPMPQNKAEAQQFFGLANFYRQFIEDFARKALPISNLLKKNIHFEWNEACRTAYTTLKNELCSDSVLAFPDFENEFVVYTDASKYALGAILQNADGRPVHFASRALKDAETRYAIVEKELLALVFAAKIFRPYLLGRHFTIRTDHAPLKWLFSMTDPSSRLTKFRLKLEEYDFTVE